MNTILKTIVFGLLMQISTRAAAQSDHFKTNNPYYSHTVHTVLNVSNTEWKKILKPELYLVAREGNTEMAYTGKYYEFDEKGTYYCAVCGNPLFLSTSKFATTCGWPSFYKAVRNNSVKYKKILLIIWYVQKFYVEDVALILVIFSMTVQNLRENVFA